MDIFVKKFFRNFQENVFNIQKNFTLGIEEYFQHFFAISLELCHNI